LGLKGFVVVVVVVFINRHIFHRKTHLNYTHVQVLIGNKHHSNNPPQGMQKTTHSSFPKKTRNKNINAVTEISFTITKNSPSFSQNLMSPSAEPGIN